MYYKLVNDNLYVSELRGKNIVLVLGTAGTGKSTLLNAIIKGTSTIEFNEKTGQYKATEEVFGINHN